MIDHGRESDFLTASDKDMDVYESMLPEDHKLCQLFDTVDFEAFRPIVESAYSAKGQPTGYAMIAFKLEVLKYYYNLSDRAVISRANTDVAFRWFLKIPIRYMFKDHTFLTLFRGRLGKERYEQLFQALVAQARKSGLVKDQLRLKDATHVLADISIPSTLALVSQIRDRLVKLILQIDAEAAAGYEQAIECMRVRTKDANDSIRLQERVELLGDIVGCAKTLLERADEFSSKIKADLQDSIDLADKILAQRQEKKRNV
jgi:transposase